jgi:hypothetical protein
MSGPASIRAGEMLVVVKRALAGPASVGDRTFPAGSAGVFPMKVDGPESFRLTDPADRAAIVFVLY